MEKEKRIKLFEDIYRDSKKGITNQDKIELITDFTNKLKSIIHQSQFLLDTLSKDIKSNSSY